MGIRRHQCKVLMLHFLFVHSSNDAPHGSFVVGSAAVMISGQGSGITRQLDVTVSRQFDNQGTIEVTLIMYYDEVPKLLSLNNLSFGTS